MLCCLCSEHKSLCWVSHSSGDVGYQWTVNISQFKISFNALYYKQVLCTVIAGCDNFMLSEGEVLCLEFALFVTLWTVENCYAIAYTFLNICILMDI